MNKTQAKAQIEGEAGSSPEVVLKSNGIPPLEKQMSPNSVEAEKLLTLRGTQFTEGRVNPSRLHSDHNNDGHFKHPIMLGASGSPVYISAADRGPEHVPPAQPPTCFPPLAELLQVCAAPAPTRPLWGSNSSSLLSGTS